MVLVVAILAAAIIGWFWWIFSRRHRYEDKAEKQRKEDYEADTF